MEKGGVWRLSKTEERLSSTCRLEVKHALARELVQAAGTKLALQALMQLLELAVPVCLLFVYLCAEDRGSRGMAVISGWPRKGGICGYLAEQ